MTPADHELLCSRVMSELLDVMRFANVSGIFWEDAFELWMRVRKEVVSTVETTDPQEGV